MRLICGNKDISLFECKSFIDRFKGFMLCKNIDKALLFNRCNSVHTFFMLEKIDIIMCDKYDRILYYYPNCGRDRVFLPRKGVVKVYETPALYFDIKIDDVLEVEI